MDPEALRRLLEYAERVDDTDKPARHGYLFRFRDGHWFFLSDDDLCAQTYDEEESE